MIAIFDIVPFFPIYYVQGCSYAILFFKLIIFLELSPNEEYKISVFRNFYTRCLYLEIVIKRMYRISSTGYDAQFSVTSIKPKLRWSFFEKGITSTQTCTTVYLYEAPSPVLTVFLFKPKL